MQKVIITTMLLALTGCVTPQVKEGKMQLPPGAATVAKQQIEVGKTNKKNVLDLLGPPDTKMQGSEVPSAGAKEIWIYKDVRSSRYSGNVSLLVAGGSSSTSLEEISFVIVYFDDRDIVKELVSREPPKQ